MTQPVKFSLLMLATALVVPACDSADAPKKADPAKKADASDAKPAADEAKPKAEKKADPWQEKLAARVLADSGLAAGGRLSAFDIINCDSGEEYCQVCRYGSSPKVMAVGTIGDEAFKKDLKDLDAIVAKYGDDKLKAFAVVTDLQDGKAITPADAAAAQAKAKSLKEELGISMPIVVPAPKEGGANKIWDEYYNITASRTVMFADGRNEVKWSGVASEDFADLNTAITEVLGS